MKPTAVTKIYWPRAHIFHTAFLVFFFVHFYNQHQSSLTSSIERFVHVLTFSDLCHLHSFLLLFSHSSNSIMCSDFQEQNNLDLDDQKRACDCKQNNVFFEKTSSNLPTLFINIAASSHITVSFTRSSTTFKAKPFNLCLAIVCSFYRL